jgi:signal transduction histidine kinase/streptogramin lyase
MPFTKRARLSLLLLTCLPVILQAQQRYYRFSHLTNEDGLSQAVINVLFKDKEGFLWLGTDYGLNRYDGHTLVPYFHYYRDSTTMAANEVYALCEDHAGNIWAAHYNGGLSCYHRRTGRFSRLQAGPGRLSTNRVYGLLCDSRGLLWIRTVKGISRLDPASGHIQHLEDSSYANEYMLEKQSLVQTADHCIWFGGKNGLIRLQEDGRLFAVASWDTAQQGRQVKSLCLDKSRQLWALTEKGVFRITGYERNSRPLIQAFCASPSFPGTGTALLVNETRGEVWIGTDGNGIYILDKNNARTIAWLNSGNIKDNLTSNSVTDFWQDEQQHVFVATARGLNTYSPFYSSFNNYDHFFRKQQGFAHPIYAIQDCADGSLLLGNKEALYQFFPAENRLVKIATAPGLPEKICFYCIYPISPRLYLTGTEEGLLELEKQPAGFRLRRPEQYAELQALLHEPITHVERLSDSVAYISNYKHGFYKWNLVQKKITHYLRDTLTGSGPVDNRVINIVAGGPGQLVICTKGGFSLFDYTRETFRNFAPDLQHYPRTLPSNNIKSAYAGKRYLWITTFGAGLQRLDLQTQQFKGYTTREGLPNDGVYAVLPDQAGRLWLPTNNGIGCLDTVTGLIKNYFTTDGLPDNEFNGFSAHAGAHNTLYFSTLNGLVSFNPGNFIPDPYLPEIALTAVQVNGRKKYTINPFALEQLTLPHNENDIQLEVASFCYAGNSNVLYKFKLEGYETQWSPPTPVPSVHYAQLPPGRYRLQVLACNGNGRWLEKPFRFPLVIHPAWYQTWWFRIACIALLALALYALYRYRINQILRVERLRRKISSDLHDDIGSALSSINIYSQLARTETNNADYINSIQHNTQDIINNLDDLVWNINPKNDHLQQLADRMQSFGEPLMQGKNIRCRFLTDIENKDLTVPIELRQHIYLSFKEIINNILKHAHCTACTVVFTQRKQAITLDIQDNGTGFDPLKVKPGRNGLHNLEQRVKEVQGNISIQSSPGRGTHIFIRYPLNRSHKYGIAKKP